MPCQPVPRPDGRVQALITTKCRMARNHAMHDLSGIKDDRVAARLTEMAGKSTIGMLQRKLPVDYSARPRPQVESVNMSVSGQEGFHDISARFGITW